VFPARSLPCADYQAAPGRPCPFDHLSVAALKRACPPKLYQGNKAKWHKQAKRTPSPFLRQQQSAGGGRWPQPGSLYGPKHTARLPPNTGNSTKPTCCCSCARGCSCSCGSGSWTGCSCARRSESGSAKASGCSCRYAAPQSGRAGWAISRSCGRARGCGAAAVAHRASRAAPCMWIQSRGVQWGDDHLSYAWHSQGC
jgi:hypothetical protein